MKNKLGDRQHVPTDQAAIGLPPCAGCGQPTDGMCMTDCGMSFCGDALCDKCQHVDEKFGWRHERRAAPSAPAEVEGLVGDLITGWTKLISDAQQEMADDVEDADHTGERTDLWDYHVFVDITTAQATKDTLTALQAENERLREAADASDGNDIWRFWNGRAKALMERAHDLRARAELAEAERDALSVAVREIKEAWDWWREDSYDRCSSVVEDAIITAYAKLKGEV